MRTLILVLILLFAFGCRPHNNDKTPEKEKDRILDSLQRISPDLAISFIDDRSNQGRSNEIFTTFAKK